MTRKWKTVLVTLLSVVLLVAAAVVALAQRHDERNEHLRHALVPLLEEGTTRVTAAMQIALAADAIDYSAAVEGYKRALFELEERIQEAEELGDPSDHFTTAALLYLKSGQSVIRELHRDCHTAQALQNARERVAAGRQIEAGLSRDRLYNVQRQAWELSQDRKMTNGRLLHAARMFQKNIAQYRLSLGAEHLAPPDMVAMLIERAAPEPRNSP